MTTILNNDKQYVLGDWKYGLEFETSAGGMVYFLSYRGSRIKDFKRSNECEHCGRSDIASFDKPFTFDQLVEQGILVEMK